MIALTRAGIVLTVLTSFQAAATSVIAEEIGAKVYLNGMKSTVMVLNVDKSGQGSGSVISVKDGHVLTNWHVVRGGTDMVIIFPMWENGRPIVEQDRYNPRKSGAEVRRYGLYGKVLISDEKADLAVIKLTDPAKIPKGTQAVRFPEESVFAGSKLYSIGNPAASEAMWNYTPGEVRQVYKKSWKSGGPDGKIIGEHECRIVEATSPISAGDSGGPCFNDKGEQIGVAQGGMRANNSFSYFVDVSEVKTFLKAKKVAFNQEASGKIEPSKDPDGTVVKEQPKLDPAAIAELAKKEKEAAEAAKQEKLAVEAAKQEKSATSMLNLLRPLTRDESKFAFASEKLEQLIKMYPKTEAAKEAAVLLKKIR